MGRHCLDRAINASVTASQSLEGIKQAALASPTCITLLAVPVQLDGETVDAITQAGVRWAIWKHMP